MNRRLTRWLLALYPRYWRDRYGPEVADLNEELINAGETTRLRAGLSMIAGAAIERGRALAGSRQAVMASVLAALIAVAGLTFGLSNTRSASQSASSVSLDCAVKAAHRQVYVQGKPGNWTAVARPGFTVTLEPGQAAKAPATVNLGKPATLNLSKKAASARARARQVVIQIRRQLAKKPVRCGPGPLAGFAIAAPANRIIIMPLHMPGGPANVVLPRGAQISWRAAKVAASKP
jgi:hypothetical protein